MCVCVCVSPTKRHAYQNSAILQIVPSTKMKFTSIINKLVDHLIKNPFN